MVLGSSLVAALLPLMCCFLPALLSVGAGFGFLGSTFEWVHPAQPSLTIFSAGALGFAHLRNFQNSRKCSGEETCQHLVSLDIYLADSCSYDFKLLV